MITAKKKKAPEFTEKLKDKTEIEGNVAVFEATVQAEPQAEITWTLNGEKLVESDVGA